jgi:hypothetical protein
MCLLSRGVLYIHKRFYLLVKANMMGTNYMIIFHFQQLLIKHTFDVMHIEKYICESIIKFIFGIKDSSKYTIIWRCVAFENIWINLIKVEIDDLININLDLEGVDQDFLFNDEEEQVQPLILLLILVWYYQS